MKIYLIDHILQNKPPTPIPIDEFMKEYGSDPWAECPIESTPNHVNIIEFGPSKTLNINPSLSTKQE